MLRSYLFLAVSLLPLMSLAQDAPPPNAEPEKGAVQELTPEQLASAKENLAALRCGRERIEEVFGPDKFPNIKASIVTPSPKATPEEAERDLNAFTWKREEVKSEKGEVETTVVMTIGVARFRSRAQFAYNIAHIVMEVESRKLPEELIVREPVAMIATSGGKRVVEFAQVIEKKGGPMCLKDLEAYLKSRTEAAAPKTDAERTAAEEQQLYAQATFHLIGFDLHRRKIIRKFYDGEIDCEAFKKELDPAKAWERQKDELLPPTAPAPRPRGPIDIRAVG